MISNDMMVMIDKVDKVRHHRADLLATITLK